MDTERTLQVRWGERKIGMVDNDSQYSLLLRAFGVMSPLMIFLAALAVAIDSWDIAIGFGVCSLVSLHTCYCLWERRGFALLMRAKDEKIHDLRLHRDELRRRLDALQIKRGCEPETRIRE